MESRIDKLNDQPQSKVGTMKTSTGRAASRYVSLAVGLLLVAGCGGNSGDDTPAVPETSATSSGAEEQAAYTDGDEVRIVVPYSAGGGYDTSTRLLATCVETAFADVAGADVDVAVQNIEGASGRIGTNEVYNSGDDGTMVLMNAVDIMVPQDIVEGAEYDVGEFAPIAQFGRGGRVVIVSNEALPDDADFTDLIERSQSDPVVFGGAGLQNQIAMMTLLLESGDSPIQLRLVEVEGTSEGVASMLRGEIEAYLVGTDSGINAAEEHDEIRILTVLDESDPLRANTDAPTLLESAVPNAEQIGALSGANIRAFFAPPATNESALATLQEVFAAALSDESCVGSIGETGDTVTYGPPDELENDVATFVSTYEEFAAELEPVLDELIGR